MSSLINQVDSYKVTEQDVSVLKSSDQQLVNWLFQFVLRKLCQLGRVHFHKYIQELLLVSTGWDLHVARLAEEFKILT